MCINAGYYFLFYLSISTALYPTFTRFISLLLVMGIIGVSTFGLLTPDLYALETPNRVDATIELLESSSH